MPYQFIDDDSNESNVMNFFSSPDSPSYFEKLGRTTLTISQKLQAVQQNKLEKEASLEGYRKGYITFAGDADSGTAIDEETGQAFDYRLNAFNHYDAADSMKNVYGSRYDYKRARQPKVVAELTGKRIEDLTEEDFENVKKYQFGEMI